MLPYHRHGHSSCIPACQADLLLLLAGAFGEIAREAPQAVAGLGEVLGRAIVKDLRCEHPTNRRNAAFTCGNVLAAIPQELAGQLQALLQVWGIIFGFACVNNCVCV